MRKLNFKNRWVLVTGASSGLGREMARQLAYQHQANLILLARRSDKLIQLKEELETAAKIEVSIIIADLSDPLAVEKATNEILKVELYAAILNAGVTYFGPNNALSADQYEAMLQTNVNSVVYMTNRLVNDFEMKQAEGGIMLVASMAALFPITYQAVYSGTKAFILAYATALSDEIINKNISLTVFLPGGIATEMTADEKFADLRRWLMPVEKVAMEGIYALQNRKRKHIPGFLNRFGKILIPLLPSKFVSAKMTAAYRRSLIKAGILPDNKK